LLKINKNIDGGIMVFLKKCTMLIVSLAFVSMAGCASSKGSFRQISAPIVPLEKFKTIQLTVDSSVENADIEVDGLKKLIPDLIKQDGKWEVLEKGELDVHVTVSNIKRVSRASRVLLGPFAGRAITAANIVVTEKATGKEISRFEVEGQSKGGTMWGGTTDESVGAAAKQIVEALNSK
jgi:hypothetical protein